MGRPRPRVEGKPAARFANTPVKSQAPDNARLVPKKLSVISKPRQIAASRILSDSEQMQNGGLS